MDLLSILTKIIKIVSVVYHFVANFLPFKNTFLIILPVRDTTAAASDVGVMSGMHDNGT